MDDEKKEKEDEIKKSETQPLSERIHYGSGFWVSFWNGTTSVLLQPHIIYDITKDFKAGAGINYYYISQSIPGINKPITDNAIGFNFFLRQRIAKQFFVQVEYMPMNFTTYNSYGDSKRIWGQSFFVGGCIESGHSYIMVLYDLLWQPWDPSIPSTNNYATSFLASPLDVRFGFLF